MEENKEKNKKAIKEAVISLICPIIFILVLAMIYFWGNTTSSRDFVIVIATLLITLILSIVMVIWALIDIKKSSRKAIIIVLLLATIVLWGALFLYFRVLPISGCSGCVAREVAIKADLSGLRRQEELYAQENNGSYEGFCNIESVGMAAEGIKNNGSRLFCNDSFNEWSACAQLVRNDKDYYCVDSTEKSEKIRGKCDEDWNYTSCP